MKFKILFTIIFSLLLIPLYIFVFISEIEYFISSQDVVALIIMFAGMTVFVILFISIIIGIWRNKLS